MPLIFFETGMSPSMVCWLSMSLVSESGDVPWSIIRSWFVITPVSWPSLITRMWWMLYLIILSTASKQ